jgi:hypothetical protein
MQCDGAVAFCTFRMWGFVNTSLGPRTRPISIIAPSDAPLYLSQCPSPGTILVACAKDSIGQKMAAQTFIYLIWHTNIRARPNRLIDLISGQGDSDDTAESHCSELYSLAQPEQTRLTAGPILGILPCRGFLDSACDVN